jgi:hypothetical protein
MEMNDKEHYDFMIKAGMYMPESDVWHVEALANKLIAALYRPTPGQCKFVVDRARVRRAGIDNNEPINWGDLSATVTKKEGLYIVNMEEASPGACPTLCEYIERYLQKWGWPAVAETEW